MDKRPSFQQEQFALTHVIRNADGEVKGIEPRRITIYQELFFNNIEGFCSNAFPITKQVLGAQTWTQLVRDFFITTKCETPHFIEISKEFLTYLITKQDDLNHLPFLSELAHYEWVELDLDVKPVEVIELSANKPQDDISLTSQMYLAEACYPLFYNYPVHFISEENVETITAEPTPLVVYRNSDFEVKFTLVDQLTVIMLQLIQQNNGINKSLLAAELSAFNESFTEQSMLAFLDKALPTFLELKLIYIK